MAKSGELGNGSRFDISERATTEAAADLAPSVLDSSGQISPPRREGRTIPPGAPNSDSQLRTDDAARWALQILPAEDAG
jgi:hypothetical protein